MPDSASSLAPHVPAAGIPVRLPAIPGVAWLLAAMCLVFAVAAPGFVSAANLGNVLQQASVLLLLALPMTLIILTEGLDLSMGAALSVCTLVLALVQIATGSTVFGIAAALAAAIAIGLVNGALIAAFELPPFVATLGTLGVAQGLALVVAEGRSAMGVSDSLRWFWEGQLLGTPVPLWIAGTAWVLTHLLLHRTSFGVRVFALGGNREALQFAGISVKRSLVCIYALGGLGAGLASVLLTARINGGHPLAAIGMEFDAIAAVAVGGTALRRGKGGLTGTVLGVLAVGVMRNGLNLLSVPASLQVAAVGAFVVGALAVDVVKQRG